jgi:acetyl esterase/lipase
VKTGLNARKVFGLSTTLLAAFAGVCGQAPSGPAADVPSRTLIPETVRVAKNITYCTGGGHALLMDLYLPRTPRSNAIPGVVWVHGGGWRIGSKENAPFAIALAARGMVAASINYRLSGEAQFPAAIEDVKCAIRYLRANAHLWGVDSDRLGIAGSSAGGQLALLAGTAPESAHLEGSGGWPDVSSRVSAVVSWFGPSDFSVGPEAFERGKGPSIIAFLGGRPVDKPENYLRASPVTWVAKGDPPILIFHGDQDTTVPFDQSVRMMRAYRKAGLHVKLVRVHNAGHNFTPAGSRAIRPSIEQITELSLRFFENNLGQMPE